MPILVVAEHDGASLMTPTLNTITAARQLGDDVDLLIAGSQAQQAAAEAATVEGLRKIWLADAPHLARATAENLEPLLCEVAQHYSHVLFPATSFGKNVAPRIAGCLDVAQVSDIVAIRASNTFDRLMYAGSIVATVQCDERIKVLSVRTTAFDAAPHGTGSAPIEPLPVPPGADGAIVVEQHFAQQDRPDLLNARIVVSGGRGLAGKEHFARLLEPLAAKLGAAIGASRAAVDEGFASADCQVGQTGKVVAPHLYIAVGISGAAQHLAGMKDSKIIVAINKDPDAPIFSVADYGLVGDLFAVVEEFTTKLC